MFYVPWSHVPWSLASCLQLEFQLYQYTEQRKRSRRLLAADTPRVHYSSVNDAKDNEAGRYLVGVYNPEKGTQPIAITHPATRPLCPYSTLLVAHLCTFVVLPSSFHVSWWQSLNAVLAGWCCM